MIAQTPEPWHGTVGGYNNRGCRCESCTAASTAAARAAKIRRAERLVSGDAPHVQHGRANTYDGWGCRCEPCTAAASAARLATTHSRIARAGQASSEIDIRLTRIEAAVDRILARFDADDTFMLNWAAEGAA